MMKSHSCQGQVEFFSNTSFTAEVEALRDWLLECGSKTIAIESTGNYWITAYDVLEAAGIEVCLVNARHVKGVPGRRTDVQDAARQAGAPHRTPDSGMIGAGSARRPFPKIKRQSGPHPPLAMGGPFPGAG